MATDHIIIKYQTAVINKLHDEGRIAFDESLYSDAKKYFCMQHRRVDKAINQLVDEGKVKFVPAKSPYRAMDIVLHSEVTE